MKYHDPGAAGFVQLPGPGGGGVKIVSRDFNRPGP